VTSGTPGLAATKLPLGVSLGNLGVPTADRHYGIVSYSAAKLSGLPSKKLDVTVPTKIQ
jgi:hypothetical protein